MFCVSSSCENTLTVCQHIRLDLKWSRTWVFCVKVAPLPASEKTTAYMKQFSIKMTKTACVGLFILFTCVFTSCKLLPTMFKHFDHLLIASYLLYLWLCPSLLGPTGTKEIWHREKHTASTSYCQSAVFSLLCLYWSLVMNHSYSLLFAA